MCNSFNKCAEGGGGGSGIPLLSTLSFPEEPTFGASGISTVLWTSSTVSHFLSLPEILNECVQKYYKCALYKKMEDVTFKDLLMEKENLFSWKDVVKYISLLKEMKLLS